MSTAVRDANVLASGFVRRHPLSPPVQLVDAWQAGRYTRIVSAHILGELARTFADPSFRRRMTPQQVARAVALLRRQATWTGLTVQVQGVATHPEDDLVLATAVSAPADYLVTGDTQLQRLGSYQGVRILSPRAFLAVLTP